MSQHDEIVGLHSMIDYANEAIEAMANRSLAEFVADRTDVHGVALMIALIGESANQVPRHVRDAMPDLPWQDIIGMRHRVIHHYGSVLPERVYAIVVENLPVLVRELTEFLERTDSSSTPPQE
jgi:uncharacterized protein with HEPN domain